MKLSFKSDSGYLILKHLKNMLPEGVEIFSYYAANENLIKKLVLKADEIFEKTINDDETLSIIYDLRKPRKSNYIWTVNPVSMIEKKSENKKQVQLVIDNEKNVNFLQLRFRSTIDRNDDIFYLNFSKELGIFGIDFGRLSLDTQNKMIIAEMIYRSCKSVITTAMEDSQKFDEFSNQTLKALDNLKNYKNKLKEFSNEHHKNTLVFIKTLLSDLAHKYNCSFELTNDCIEILKNYNSSLDRLKSIIIKAAEYAYELNSFNNSELIVIEEEFLDFSESDIISIENKSKTEKERVYVNEYLERKIRIEHYLDRLENAVKRAQANKLKPTGENVSKFMEPSVTPAAITQFIKNNSTVINEILFADSTKYPLSRRYFKPLTNVILQSRLASGMD